MEGSGWIVRPGLVVTNAHVVAGIPAPLVDRGGGNAVRGEVVAFDAANDVALVRADGLDGTAASHSRRRVAARRARSSASRSTGPSW